MGCLFFFDEEVSSNNGKHVEVLDNHGMPEIRIGQEGLSDGSQNVTFEDWKQFEQFVKSVNDLKSRLEPLEN